MVLGATAMPAAAATNDVVLTRNGEWKAYAYLDMSARKACVRVYNSGSSAYAGVHYEAWDNGADAQAWDYGGDTAKSCVSIPGSYTRGEKVNVYLSFTGSSWSDYRYVTGMTLQ
ncbi:hypothetical protein [Actinoplanes sp. NPDC049316]|uniref:hypothetical protein n=1 Tax=Actinoplanes sp. NPDC049316 TaxID=3154727 RepID=UPI003430AAD2